MNMNGSFSVKQNSFLNRLGLQVSHLAATVAVGLVACCSALAQGAYATTYYVDPNGSNVSTRDGSSGQPWQTLSYAASRVSGGQGHIIHLNAGNYSSGEVSFPNGVSVEGAGATSTKIVSTNTSGPCLRFGGGGSNVHDNGNQFVRNLTLDGSNRTASSGITFQRRDNVKALNIVIQNFLNEGLLIEGSGWYGNDTEKLVPPYLATGIEVDGVRFIDCGSGTRGGFCSGMLLIGGTSGAKLHNLNFSSASTIPSYGIKYAVGNGGMNWGLRIYDAVFNIGGDFSIELFNVYGNSEIYNCDFNRMVSFGAQKMWSDADGTKPGTRGTANGNGPQTVRLHHSKFAGGPGDGWTVEGQISDWEFDHNYVLNPGVGLAIYTGGDPTTPSEQTRMNVKIHHNVFWTESTAYDHRAVNVGTAPLVKNIRFYNNTCYGLTYGLVIAAQYSGTKAEDIYIKNNVFKNIRNQIVNLNLKDANSTISNVVLDRNVAFNCTNVFAGSENVTNLSQSNTYTSNPGLIESGTRPEPYYVPASATAFVVDKGVTTISPDTVVNSADYSGSAPDLGAFDWKPAGTGSGLSGSYFNNSSLSGGAALTRVEAVDYDWLNGSPGAGLGTDNFSARWVGQVEAPVSGSYTLTVTADDGVRLWLGNTSGTPVIDKWFAQGPTSYSYTTTLTAGQKYDLKMEYYELSGGAVARLHWSYPGQSDQAIPVSRLYAGSSTPAPTPTPTPTPTPAPSSTTYSFEDVSSDDTAINGVHGGIDFGTGQWLADATSWAGLSKFGYSSNGTYARSFTLPSGKYLKSLRVGGTSGGTYTISDGVNTAKTGSVSSSSAVVATGWSSGGRTITITTTAPTWGLAIDDITY